MTLNQRLKAVLLGVLSIYALMITVSFVLALLIRFDWLNTDQLTWLPFIVSTLIVMVGGGISGYLTEQKGWLSGLLVSSLYIISLIGYQFLAHDTGIYSGQWLHFVIFIIATIIGSILGVQLRGQSNNT